MSDFLFVKTVKASLQSDVRAHTVPPAVGPRFAAEATSGMYSARVFLSTHFVLYLSNSYVSGRATLASKAGFILYRQ